MRNGTAALQFTIMGMFYGYPTCCITDMIERWASLVEEGQPIDASGRPLEGTGFVPCPMCAALYTDGEFFQMIDHNRSCPTPFPHGEHDENEVDARAFEQFAGHQAERLRATGYRVDAVLGPAAPPTEPSLHPTGAAV